MTFQEHSQFFTQAVQERGPISTRRLKELGSANFGSRFHKRYICACLNAGEGQTIRMENLAQQVGSGKFQQYLWVAK